MTLRSDRRPPRAEVRRRFGGKESKMTGAGRGGKTVPLSDQEPVSRDAQRGVMVESAPVATFKVSKAQLLFQLLVIPFDNPALFGHLNQSLERGISRQCRNPVLGRFLHRPAAIRSITIVQHEVRFSSNHDEPDECEQQQSGIVTSGLHLHAKRFL